MSVADPTPAHGHSTGLTRRERAADEARQRILTAAADCIVRDGLAGVRMAAIARAAGVSSGLLHYHFDTKEQLFVEVLTYSSAISDELTAQALDQAGAGPAQRLATFLDRCLPSDERLRHDWLLWQEFEVLSLRQPELAKASADLYESLYTAVADICFEGVERGDFDLPARDVRTVAEVVVAMCDGLGERVLAPDDLTLDEARSRVAFAVGRLLGHDGPLPHPARQLQESRR